MKIRYSYPPAAAPIDICSIISGLYGLVRKEKDHERFADEVKDYFSVNHCWFLSSGKASLYVILSALKKINPERNKIVVPGFTCYSVPASILKAGFDPILCDIDMDSLDFSYGQLEKIVSEHGEKISAILSTHLFGLSSDVHRIKRIASQKGIKVIEDAAQSMGNSHNKRKHGTMADVGLFSLSRGKSFSTVEGGIIVTSNDEIALAIDSVYSVLPEYSIKQIGILIVYAFFLAVFIHPSLYWLPSSLAFLKLGETVFDTTFEIKKMYFFQIGLTSRWREKLEFFNQKRTENSRYWYEILTTKHVFKNAVLFGSKNNPCIRFPLMIFDSNLRKKFLEECKSQGVGVMPSYPDSIDGIEEIKGYVDNAGKGNAKKISSMMVTLPVHPYTDGNVKKKIYRIIVNISQNFPKYHSLEMK
jgi:dTDP-4-amino-4,6-dideoxygalactose transaminase